MRRSRLIPGALPPGAPPEGELLGETVSAEVVWAERWPRRPGEELSAWRQRIAPLIEEARLDLRPPTEERRGGGDPPRRRR